ncbi:hypothetical protein GGI16_005160 [Coemansia sp. S142-1]|nr:hypothetical protein GGI16_005160 [Coemansia sp. S142-1]KAJ2341274.1 hypothetical protein GGH92_005884 [Coemansia sp. RSA 2673]
MEPGFRYSVYETTTRVSSPTMTSSKGFLATLKRLFCFGTTRHTTPSLRLASSASRMNLALAVAEQYVLVSLDNPLDDTDQTVANTPETGTPTIQCSPMSGISDNTLRTNVYCDTVGRKESRPSRGRRSLAMGSLFPKSLRSTPVSPPSYRSSTICDNHQSDSQLDDCAISPAMVAARENPLFC